MSERYVGIDLGAETIKVVEVSRKGDDLECTRLASVEHHKEPQRALRELLQDWDWNNVESAAVSGRFRRQLDLPRVPTKEAQAAGFRFDNGPEEATVVSIGSHGFSVLELRQTGVDIYRENSRCSQGTGNFLRQLVERFGLNIEEASELCERVPQPAPLSGRCPVILKTDMTHLANKGESQARILAGLYDAVCENVQVLIKPRVSPKKVRLVGGVTRSKRIRENFERFFERHGLEMIPFDEERFLYLEAIGDAVTAMEQKRAVPPLSELFKDPEETHLDRVPALSDYLDKVERLPAPPKPVLGDEARSLILGFDIGSTGSKAVALDINTDEMVWEGYISTGGNPVGAAQTLMQKFVDGPASRYPVLACGATGSGREIAGSLLATCYGRSTVYILNEIAAHAEGARFFDERVDTIFEIGGQDAKYVRLADGRVVDAAMNEACSAGTGSFIEEQGRKFSNIGDVVQLGKEALGASSGVSLGQHCSVFMAEIIDEAVAAGVENQSIIAGIYDSIIQNYLNRVKGSRSVGQVIFCQGMPFSADALAAAVVRQTGSRVIVPPNPGTVGALGIALLTKRSLTLPDAQPLDPQRFLSAQMRRKDTFVCKATKGCDEPGNLCRIDRIRTEVAGKKQSFTWGGGCSLWDSGTGKKKLPDRAPDPFREREELVASLARRLSTRRGRPRVAMTDEFQMKGLFPFFSTFLYELGFDLEVYTGADQSSLKRGIEEANVPFCAPMQQYHGLVSKMAEEGSDYLFIPMVRSLARVSNEEHASVCPIVQGSADMLRWDLGAEVATKIVSPIIDIGQGNLESKELIDSCRRLAEELGITDGSWSDAHRVAVAEQTQFEKRCRVLGKRALSFAQKNNIIPVVVLGRPYSVYNKVLNSNVPAILREQGSIAIPVDCYETGDSVPIFSDVYWGYGQRNLRAAYQVRRTTGIYSIWCSNYSCGPDSFNLHFYSYLMDGKPFATIETDGHSGDAGTKTRVEAFLHCVREDLQRLAMRKPQAPAQGLIAPRVGFSEFKRTGETLLVPRMGAGAEGLAACIRGTGTKTECLPMPDRESVMIGRRYTSGKECVPMCITLGSFIQRLERAKDTDEKFAIFMPSANGPCRFGVYNTLARVILGQLGWKDRVRIWSPVDSDYFEGVPAGISALVFTSLVASDMLLEGLHDARPVETSPGAAERVYQQYQRELVAQLELAGAGDLRIGPALLQVANGRLFGCTEVLRQAAHAYAKIKAPRPMPSVGMVGEIYVRCDPFANDFLINKLESHGIRVRFAPFSEWLEYTDYVNRIYGGEKGFNAQLSNFVQRRILSRAYSIMGDVLGWHPRTTVKETITAGAEFVRPELLGEAVLTVGGPVYEWREGLIDGVVNVGPLECMPCKVAEAQLFHVAEHEGLLSLTIPVNGDPIDPDQIDNFAFEIHSRFRKRNNTPEREKRASWS